MIDAMKKALEALELFCEHGTMDRPFERRNALYDAIEQAEKQEPVAWSVAWNNNGQKHQVTFNTQDEAMLWSARNLKIGVIKSLYTVPPKREQDNPKLQLDAIERAYFHGKQQGIAESEAVKRLWVGLTDEDVQSLEYQYLMSGVEFEGENGYWAVYRAIEAKLRERNT